MNANNNQPVNNNVNNTFTRLTTEGWNPDNEDNSEYDNLQDLIIADPEMERLDSMMERLYIDDVNESQKEARPDFDCQVYECFVCNMQLGAKDGYISGKHTYCCECVIDVFDDNTCELEKQGDKELEIEARAIRIQREREFYASYDENQDYFLWFEEQKKKYGDDPEFMAMFHVSEFTVNAVVSNEEWEYPDFTVGAVISNEDWEKKESDDRTKRCQEFYASYDGIEDYFVWLEDQKKKHGNDPEFQKSLRMFHHSVDNCDCNISEIDNITNDNTQEYEYEENNKILIATEDAAEMGDEFYENNQYLEDDVEVDRFRTPFTIEESELLYQFYINSLPDSEFINEGFMNEETGVYHPGNWEKDENGLSIFYPQMDDIRNIEYFGTNEEETMSNTDEVNYERDLITGQRYSQMDDVSNIDTDAEETMFLKFNTTDEENYESMYDLITRFDAQRYYSSLSSN